VDDHQVPVRHFGVVLSIPNGRICREAEGSRHQVRDRTYVRSKAKPANRAPCSSWIRPGNAVEIKGFATLDSLFAR